MKRYYVRIISVSFILIFLALAFETMILRQVDKKNAYRISEVLLHQVEDNILINRRDASDLYESIKDDYEIRAQSVSYILDLKPSAEFDIDELRKISLFLSIDEINIFDETGTIYAGSVPHYFGMNMDSGEQISFFKPMLTNKNLTMCQDLTPNTSEGKYMMYAMAWNEAGTKLVQIGVEPRRLLEVRKRSEMTSLLLKLPLDQGVKLYIADTVTGIIIASNPDNKSYRSLTDIGFPSKEEINQQPDNVVFNFTGCKDYKTYSKLNDLIVCVSYSVNRNLRSFFITMHLMLVYLILAALVIGRVLVARIKADDERTEQFNILTSMSKIYYSMHLIDLVENSVVEYSTQEIIKKFSDSYDKADEMMRSVITHTVGGSHLDLMLEFTDTNTIAERMINKKIVSKEFAGFNNKWFRANFITIEADENKKPVKVIFSIQNIDEEKNKEAELVYKSTTDELTKCYNRRAYEQDLKKINLKSDFIYVEFDLNGLKPVNDTIGHEAGDEVIKSAARLMKEAISSNGKVYRTGGDEFVGIVNCNLDKFDEIINEFDKMVSDWSGELVKVMSVSYGYVYSGEQNWESVLQISKEADIRMYRSKSSYYKTSGIDRRTQRR